MNSEALCTQTTYGLSTMPHIENNSILSGGDVLKMLVGLKEVGDLDIVSSDAVLSSACSTNNRPTVLAMAEAIDQLLETFDYQASPEFVSKIADKSEEVQAKHRKLLSPDRLKRLKGRFGKSLTELLVSREAYDLVPLEVHKVLDNLKTLASNLSD